MKRCWRCEQEKPLTEFWKDRRTTDGLQKACKDCQKAHNAEYFTSHREYFREKSRIRSQNTDHKARYMTNRETFKRWRSQYSASVAGRLRTLLSSADSRAKKAGIEMSLTFDWLTDVFQKQGGCCALTGIKLEFPAKVDGPRHYHPFSPSLHRSDPGKAYTPDNVLLVCTAVNIALNRFGD